MGFRKEGNLQKNQLVGTRLRTVPPVDTLQLTSQLSSQQTSNLQKSILIFLFVLVLFVHSTSSFGSQLFEEAYFGKLPPVVGGTLLNLAMVYRRLPDMEDKAEALYKRCDAARCFQQCCLFFHSRRKYASNAVASILSQRLMHKITVNALFSQLVCICRNKMWKLCTRKTDLALEMTLSLVAMAINADQGK